MHELQVPVLHCGYCTFQLKTGKRQQIMNSNSNLICIIVLHILKLTDVQENVFTQIKDIILYIAQQKVFECLQSYVLLWCDFYLFTFFLSSP